MLLKLVSVLQQKVTYPACTIERIDDLVDDFPENLEDDVCEMLCSNDADADDDYNHGLWIAVCRDTEAEVEAIVRVFPNILSREGMEIVDSWERTFLQSNSIYRIHNPQKPSP
jgi:hypothetical protein